MRTVLVSFVFALAACGGGPSCKDAVQKAAKRFGTEARDAVTTLIGKCEQDSWSAGIRSCFAGAETADKLEGCLPAPDYKTVLPPMEPSAKTKQLVAQAGKDPLKAVLFFPPHNDVAAIVRTYVEKLGLPIEEHDPFVETEVRKRYNLHGAGGVALVRGDRSYTVDVHDDLDRVIETGELARLDGDVARQLARLVRPVPHAYLIAGHGEITDPASRPSELLGRIPERRTSSLTKVLGYLEFAVAPLPADQLAKGVPADATVVLWLGPVVELGADEAAALGRYLDGGGHLLAAFDPLSPVGLGPLEDKLGVRFVAEHVVDDKTFLPQRNNASDHAFAITTRFAAHPSMTSLSRTVNKGLVLVDAGRLERLPATAAGLKVTPTIQTLDSSFVDKNSNCVLDGDEKRGSFDIGAAVERDKMRATVFADVDLFADAYVSGGAGVTMVSGPLLDDVMRWLGGLSEIVPEPVVKPERMDKAHRDALQEIEKRQDLRALARSLADKRGR